MNNFLLTLYAIAMIASFVYLVAVEHPWWGVALLLLAPSLSYETRSQP